MSETSDRLGAIRSILQDLIAPTVGRLEERVSSLAAIDERIAADLEKNAEAIDKIWVYLRDEKNNVAEEFRRVRSEVGEKVGAVDRAVAHTAGRFEGSVNEIMAKLRAEFYQSQVDRNARQTSGRLLQSPDTSADEDDT